MKNIIYLKRKMPLIAVFILLFAVASCGSYQYVGVDNDGIYGETPRTISQNEETVVVQNNSNDYYQNYFKSKALEYENINGEGAIFTDIDSYQSDNYENDSINNSYQGYGGWGQTNSQVTINVQPSFGWGGFGVWNRPFYGGFYGNRWNTWGYYDPFFYNGFYDPFYGGFYGGYYGGWYNPYRFPGHYYAFNGYNNFYGGAYYGRNNVSYSATRRNSYPSNGVGSRSTSNNTSRYNNTYRRSNSTAVNPNGSTSRSTRGSSPTVINGNSSRRNSSTTTSSSSSNNNSTYSRRSSTPAPPTNNSGNYSRSTNSGSSNSGSFSRSSGGSSGSSGGSSGGGRRR